jgi:hypothetical protein
MARNWRWCVFWAWAVSRVGTAMSGACQISPIPRQQNVLCLLDHCRSEFFCRILRATMIGIVAYLNADHPRKMICQLADRAVVHGRAYLCLGRHPDFPSVSACRP